MYITFERYNNLQTFDHAHASINYYCAILTLSDIIRRKHEVGKEMLQVRFKEVSQVALTTDIWTSRATED